MPDIILKCESRDEAALAVAQKVNFHLSLLYGCFRMIASDDVYHDSGFQEPL